MSAATEWNFDEGNEQYSYIMAHLVDGELCPPVKIGISKNPLKRLKQVQATMPGRIVLVAKFRFWDRDHARRVERQFHTTCADYRVFGEWFDIVPADAVGLMAENLKGFVDGFLRPDHTGDWYTAQEMIGVPGHSYDICSEDFGHRQ